MNSETEYTRIVEKEYRQIACEKTHQCSSDACTERQEALCVRLSVGIHMWVGMNSNTSAPVPLHVYHMCVPLCTHEFTCVRNMTPRQLRSASICCISLTQNSLLCHRHFTKPMISSTDPRADLS